MRLQLFVILALATSVVAQNRQEWDAGSYPNPTADGYQRCNMKSPSSVCDPDAVLSESQRYRLNYELNQLESRTRQLHGDNFCSKKGIVAAVAISRHVRGGSDNAVKVMANDMLRRWTLDKQCSKSLVIVLATDDKKFWVARDSRVPVYAAEFTDLFNEQKALFKQGDYQQALLNILEGTWDKALAKQGPGAAPSDDGASRGQPFQPSDPGSKRRPSPSGGGFSPLSIIGKIPLWVWLGIFLIVIPLLCCCCCIYMCCCRGNKGEGGNKRQSAADEDPEQRPMGGGRGRFGGGGGGGGLPGFLSGIGGGMAGNAIGNFFRSRGQRGGATGGGTVVDDGGGGYGGGGGGYPPASGGGGYQPGVPQKGGGRGLYPSAEVKDEGGGGSW